ncbi:hypothetical protein SBDP1_520010 [Syntrophobacter sp. SbD1]|nr:hypothetical protein SBDP1_520010 [Syntrophobacter sp. SbD1]
MWVKKYFHSPDLEGFSAIRHFVEDCIHKAKINFSNPVRGLARRLEAVAINFLTVQLL